MEPVGDPRPSVWEVLRQRCSFFHRLLPRLGIHEDWCEDLAHALHDGTVGDTTPPALEEAVRDGVALPELCELIAEHDMVLAVELLAVAVRAQAVEVVGALLDAYVPADVRDWHGWCVRLWEARLCELQGGFQGCRRVTPVVPHIRVAATSHCLPAGRR